MSEGLTQQTMMRMPFLKLARIVNNPNYISTDRLKAANCLHMRSKSCLNGAGWLAMANDEKAEVRKALTFYTTGDSLTYA